MLLSTLYLANFRNFSKKEVLFDSQLTLIVGENARGKTSLLEGIYTSVFGKGYRESREQELIQWDQDQALVESTFTENDAKTVFQIRLLRTAEDRVTKEYFVNKTKKSSMQYKDFQTKAVLFAPEHISIVDGSPSTRRTYFDTTLCEFDKEYRKRLRNYETALRKRNKVLELYQNEFQLDQELPFWNTYLLEQAAYITKTRENYMQFLNENPHVDGKEFAIEYLKNEFNEERMKKVYEQEKRMRRTVIGPQKDEFLITLKN
ncbi:MAG TPA: AAA family ATPase, partial [Candidatus Woesebacteria bacterium]|nr:AAA family ATPase [Candidatus Woesebacteria bacterium]